MSDTDLAFRATLDGSGFASGAQNINNQLQQMGFHTQTATAGLGGIGTMLGTMPTLPPPRPWWLLLSVVRWLDRPSPLLPGRLP